MIKLAPRYQLLVGLALAALLAMTRGQHFASVNLPSASWAVFFLAGVLVRPKWVFPALFLEASLLDFAAIQWAGVSDWCMSPAYWMLVPGPAEAPLAELRLTSLNAGPRLSLGRCWARRRCGRMQSAAKCQPEPTATSSVPRAIGPA